MDNTAAQMIHYGCVVTDLTKAGSTIKMSGRTKYIQGVNTDEPIKLLSMRNNTTYVVGSSYAVKQTLLQFAKALQDDFNYSVVYNEVTNRIEHAHN